MPITDFPIPTSPVSSEMVSFLQSANNAAARTALGLGTAAVAATGDFDAAGSAASAQAAAIAAAASDATTKANAAEAAAEATAANANNLSSGTVPDARFPATLPAASGANLTALNATNLGSGTVPAARMPALTGPVSTSAGAVATTLSWEISFACSDTTTPITSGTKKGWVPAPFDGTLTEVFITVGTAPTGSSALFDLTKNGTTMLSTVATIEATETSSLDAGTQPVISVSTFLKGNILAIDFDQVGATIAGAWVIATLRGTRTA